MIKVFIVRGHEVAGSPARLRRTYVDHDRVGCIRWFDRAAERENCQNQQRLSAIRGHTIDLLGARSH